MHSEDNRSWVNAGAALFHLNEPEQNFTDDILAQRPMRTTLYALSGIGVGERSTVVIDVLGQLQEEQTELVLTAGARYKVKEDADRPISVQLTGAVRMAPEEMDAIIPAVALFIANWRFGFSYDVNVSEFEVATNGAGGPEFSVMYTVPRVKPLKTFKACPIF